MRALPRWVVWRYLVRKGKRTKVPFRPELPESEASTTDPSTWSSFATALAAFLDEDNRLDGIGFVFSPDDDLAGVDFDNCLDEDGTILDWARPHLERLVGYAEVSPSGRGVKVFTRGRVPEGKGRKLQKLGDDKRGAIEVYGQGRYFTVTGNVTDANHEEIGDGSDAFARLHAEWFPPKAPRPRTPDAAPIDLDDAELIRKAERAVNGGKFSALMGGSTEGHPSKSEADLALCSLLAFWTGGAIDRIDRLFRQSGLCNEKWLERPDYRERTIARALEGTKFYEPGRNGHAPQPAPQLSPPPDPPSPVAEAVQPPRSRPQIEVTTERHEVVRQSIEALAADPMLYSRAGSLVTVARTDLESVKLTARTEMKETLGAPRILELSESVLSCHLSKHAEYYQVKKDRNGEDFVTDVHVPDWCTRAVATLKYWKGIRPLAAVAECPYPRPDGSLVETAGYDDETATLYLPSREFPPVPKGPTRADAKAAWDRIAHHFRYFPFATEEDRVVVLAGMLTVIARPSISGPVPGIAVNGNKASTGKGLLIDMISIPGIGRRAPTSTYPDDPNEAGKVELAIALSGALVIHFDNVKSGSSYGNSALDSALTSASVNGRVLGSSRMTGDIPLRVCWFLSGNNVSPGDDAYRRWLVCNISSDLEHPERRGDITTDEDKSPRKLITDRRGEIVRDALTILRAHADVRWLNGGWAPMGSFDEWDRIIRGAVWYATGLDCLATQYRMAEESPDRLAKIALLEGWRELPGGRVGQGGVTSTEAVGLLEGNPEKYPTLHGVLLQKGKLGKITTSTALGSILRGLKNNLTGGYRLLETGKRHSATCWVVEVVGHKSNNVTESPTSPITVEPEEQQEPQADDLLWSENL